MIAPDIDGSAGGIDYAARAATRAAARKTHERK
jgi:hypothetical protein